MAVLDVKRIVEDVISNYDYFSQKLLDHPALEKAYFSCPLQLEECIQQRQCYSCTLHLDLQVKKLQSKSLPNTWPIMIGSKLDVAFRYKHALYVSDVNLFPNLLEDEEKVNDIPNIAITCFIINGNLKQIPFYLTNDVANVHVVRNVIVRVYSYTRDNKGQELNFHIDDGRLILRLTNGREIEPTPDDLQTFFKCPHPVDAKYFMRFVYRDGFDIDHLGNKIAFTPGYMFYKLFYKSLLVHLTNNDWTKVQNQHKKVVQKSIIGGDFSHVLSKKTLFYKENQVAHKMVSGANTANISNNNEQLREIGSNNQVFVEKKTSCYRDITLQNFQLIPHWSLTVFFQISQRAKMRNALSFKDSHVGFLCICGTAETRNVGRQMMLARDVIVSRDSDVTLVYEALQLEHDPTSPYAVVVNAACIRVTLRCFRGLDLHGLKKRFRTIECFVVECFAIVTYKIGMFFKRLANGLLVSPKDLVFWTRGENVITFPFISSYLLDLIPFYRHNAFSKNVLTINTLRNAVLAPTPDYAIFFKDTVSLFAPYQADWKKELLPAADAFSRPWVIKMPKMKVMFTSYRGMTQEDCITLVGDDVRCFDCVKLYTVKVRFRNKGPNYFRVASGPCADPQKTFLGTAFCHAQPLDLQAQSANVKLESVAEHASNVFFQKPNYKILSHHLYADQFLFVTVAMDYPCVDGNKLCSLAGQKGVVRRSSVGPYGFDSTGRRMDPVLLVNPEAIIKRQTMGQVLEMKNSDGRDCDVLFNASDQRVQGTALIGSAFYFPINYMSLDHLYVGFECMRDKISGQPVRGRSRNGGMKQGFQEITNGYRCNGLSECYVEMLHHSDNVITSKGLAVPKSVFVSNEDLKFFKSHIKMNVEPSIVRVPPEAIEKFDDLGMEEDSAEKEHPTPGQ